MGTMARRAGGGSCSGGAAAVKGGEANAGGWHGTAGRPGSSCSLAFLVFFSFLAFFALLVFFSFLDFLCWCLKDRRGERDRRDDALEVDRDDAEDEGERLTDHRCRWRPRDRDRDDAGDRDDTGDRDEERERARSRSSCLPMMASAPPASATGLAIQAIYASIPTPCLSTIPSLLVSAQARTLFVSAHVPERRRRSLGRRLVHCEATLARSFSTVL